MVVAVAFSLVSGVIRPAVAQSFAVADAERDGTVYAHVGLIGQTATASDAEADLASDTTKALGERQRSILVPRLADPDSVYRAYPDADTTGTLRERPQPLTVFGYYRLFLYDREHHRPVPEPRALRAGVRRGRRVSRADALAQRPGTPQRAVELRHRAVRLHPVRRHRGDREQHASRSTSASTSTATSGPRSGTFGVRAGGIHWYNLSPFTIGVYQVLDRFTIFDRTPWEGVNGTAKYDSYFETGQANPGDQRWNYQAFQGLILDGRQLPGGIGFDAFWGKTQPNGGLPGAVTDPSETVAGEGEAGDVPTLPRLQRRGPRAAQLHHRRAAAEGVRRQPRRLQRDLQLPRARQPDGTSPARVPGPHGLVRRRT